jgi:hypothetical protein
MITSCALGPFPGTAVRSQRLLPHHRASEAARSDGLWSPAPQPCLRVTSGALYVQRGTVRPCLAAIRAGNGHNHLPFPALAGCCCTRSCQFKTAVILLTGLPFASRSLHRSASAPAARLPFPVHAQGWSKRSKRWPFQNSYKWHRMTASLLKPITDQDIMS